MKKIKEIKIEGTPFFKEDFSITFDDGLNCIMGGRGTGKSTILHMIYSAINNNAENDETTYGILKNNLGEGKITLTIQGSDGKSYQIYKTLNEDPQPYMVNSDSFIPLGDIKKDIECDIYKTLEVEDIGLNNASRLKLIDKMLGNDVDLLIDELERMKINLDENTRSSKTENSRFKNLTEKLKDFDNAEKDLVELKKDQPKDLVKEEKEAFEKADQNEKIRMLEQKSCNNAISEVKSLLVEHEDRINHLKSFLDQKLVPEKIINNDILDAFFKEVQNACSDLIQSREQGQAILKSVLKSIEPMNLKLSKRHADQQAEFVALKQKFEKHKLYYSKYNKISKKVHDKKELQKNLKDLQDKRNLVKEKRRKLIAELNKIKKEIFHKRFGKIEHLNKLFEGSIKITLTFSGITDQYEQALQKAFRGSGMRYNTIIPSIVENFTPDKFAQIIHEKDLESLRKIEAIDQERSDAIFELFFESDAIYEIESLYCPDLPEFFLRVDKKNKTEDAEQFDYKRTDELSTGQRCTTILPIIFAVSNNPLLIDQPEDNLDNEFISDTIHKLIQKEKVKRQLIFITHNPNIPVLSDSEYNLFLSYLNKRSYIENDGSVEAVKTSILKLLEGGQEAFDKRERLYSA